MNTLNPTTAQDVSTHIAAARAWFRTIPTHKISKDYFTYTNSVNAIYPGATKLTDRQLVQMYKGVMNIKGNA